MNELLLPYPVSVNNYWRKYNNIMVISKKGIEYKKYVKFMYCKIKPVNDDIKLEITILPKLTKEGIASKILIDIDNGFKCILDSLIGIVYYDDKQVKELHIKYGKAIKGGGTIVNYNIIRENS